MFKGINTQDKKRSRDVNGRETEREEGSWGRDFAKERNQVKEGDGNNYYKKVHKIAGMFIQLLVIQFLNSRGY